jgi:predicted nucleic acid-binding protein
VTTADAVDVALAVELGAPFLSDDQKLMNARMFPKYVTLLRLPLA